MTRVVMAELATLRRRRLVGVLAFMAAVLLAAEILTFLGSASLAPGQGVDASAWFTVDGLGNAVVDYVALAGLSAWALYGMTLGVVVRSVAIAVGVGVAWAGPIEHIAQTA